jgi:aspartate kinase
MNVLKFGGTSVGSVENMHRVKNIINTDTRKIVVLSAMSGTTNTLVEISKNLENSTFAEAKHLIAQLNTQYIEVINKLYHSSKTKNEALNYLGEVTQILNNFADNEFNPKTHLNILAQGELISTTLFTLFLNENNIKATLLPALQFMRLDTLKEPDYFYIKQQLNQLISRHEDTKIFITQGFITLDYNGDISNLQRGGSDYTATIIGASLNTTEVQIWTDIDGFHNNDPRFVEDTHPISQLSFEEAAELAYFGAKILHPQTVIPVREKNIPVRLKNTILPDANGTLINSEIQGEGIKAIAAKDGITTIKIKSARMLLAHGFLKKVFDVFEQYETSIDMITTSEIAVSLTIDDTTFLHEICKELEKIASIEIETNRTIICLVGNNIVNHHETPQLFQILQDVNVRMISYGGSNNNISLLINSNDKLETLRKLNRYVFEGLLSV